MQWMDARWIRTSNEHDAASRSEKKKWRPRVLFRNRSNRCRDVGMIYPTLYFSHSRSLFFNQLFPSFSGRIHWLSPTLWRVLLFSLSYGCHYRRAHASISHFRFSEPRSSENLRERAITSRASVAYTTIFFDQGFITRERYIYIFFFYLWVTNESVNPFMWHFDRFGLAFLALYCEG